MKIFSKRFLAFILSLILLFSGSLCTVYAVDADDATADYEEKIARYQSMLDEKTEDKTTEKSDLNGSDKKLQNIDSYNYLKNYLKTYGDVSGSSYILSSLKYGSSAAFFFAINYNPSTGELYCDALYESSSNLDLYINLELLSSETSGHQAGALVQNTYSGYTVYGFTTVYPTSYSGTMKMSYTDSYGYSVNDYDLSALVDEFFDISMDEWNTILTSKARISLGNFGFTNLYNRKEVPGTEKKYKITYDANGGFGAPSSQEKKEGESVTLSTAYPTRDGYTFAGWSTSKNSIDAEYMPGDVYSADSNIVLYAVWIKAEEDNKENDKEEDKDSDKEEDKDSDKEDVYAAYTITYDANGGNGIPAPQQKTENEAIILSSGVPTRTGYKFLGWSKNKNSTVAEYQPGAVYSDNGNVTLYAIWAKVEDTPVVYPTVAIVNNPGTTEQDYGVQLALTAKATNLPKDAQIVWYLDGQQTAVTGENSYLECTKDSVVTVKLHGADGQVLLDADGNEISDSETVKVENGFFRRLIAFFKKLFRGTTIVYQ